MSMYIGIETSRESARTGGNVRARIALGWLILLGCALLCAPQVVAQDPAGLPGVLGVQVHGFASPGFLLSTGNNYLARSKRGSPEFTEIGINFTRSLGNTLSTGVQLFARDLGNIGNYSA